MEKVEAIRTLEAANSEPSRITEAVRWALLNGDNNTAKLLAPHFIDDCSEPATKAVSYLHMEEFDIRPMLGALFVQLNHISTQAQASSSISFVLGILSDWHNEHARRILIYRLLGRPSFEPCNILLIK